VQTVDFFPPVVDDPFDFGRVAAANALSDIYAMGAEPVTALNIAAFPEGDLENEILVEILRGGAAAAEQANVAIVGGHTVRDKELKYGLSVTGFVHPDKIVMNSSAKVGDKLILTKPLGSGVLTTALKAEKLESSEYEELIEVMSSLNRDAARAMIASGAHACTDITGYGLLGHALEMAEASGVSLALDAARVPLMRSCLEYVRRGMLTGGGGTNRMFLEDKLRVGSGVEEELIHAFFDPQTSGGLLISSPPEKCDELLEELLKSYARAAVIGEVLAPESVSVIVR